MNLLCPNCEKMLTVPEEFAGQMMKCPLCAGTFTVPTLPGAPSDVYSVQEEQAPPPPSPGDFQPPPPSAPPPSSTATTTVPPPPAPSTATLPPEGYQHTATIWFSPKVLPWVAPVCLLLIFILQLFFSWVGLYPGGDPAVTQNAWQAAFGFATEDGDMKPLVPAMQLDEKDKPWSSTSILTIFYLLLFFPVLAVTVASVALDHLHLKLPPGVAQVLPWRWGIGAAANLILFLFLGLQLLMGFSLDSRYTDWVDNQIKDKEKAESKGAKTTQQKKLDTTNRDLALSVLHHTFWLRLAVFLHLTAIACAALMFWIGQRGPHRPLPRVELLW